MKKIKLFLLAGLAMPALALSIAPFASAAPASGLNLDSGVTAARGDGAADSVEDPSSLVKTVINFMLYVVGILSVVFLIWGGIRYTTSSGDSNKVTSAKNTIMYAVIGLIVAILAYAIVNFVMKQAQGA